jgi:hypothetical protein
MKKKDLPKEIYNSISNQRSIILIGLPYVGLTYNTKLSFLELEQDKNIIPVYIDFRSLIDPSFDNFRQYFFEILKAHAAKNNSLKADDLQNSKHYTSYNLDLVLKSFLYNKNIKLVIGLNFLGLTRSFANKLFLWLKYIRDSYSSQMTFLVISDQSLDRKIGISNLGEFKLIGFQRPKYLQPNDSKQSVIEFDSWNKDKRKIPEKRIKMINDLAGGITGLCKGIYRYISEHKIKHITINELLKSTDILQMLDKIWENFSDEDRIALKNISKNEDVYELSDYLKNSGILNKSNTRIRSKLFEQKVISESLGSDFIQIEDITNELIISQKRTGLRLNKRESTLILSFMTSSNNFLSREEIAQIMWGKTWREDYSDYSVSQQIYRIRNKLKKVRNKRINIETIKNKGFQMSLN